MKTNPPRKPARWSALDLFKSLPPRSILLSDQQAVDFKDFLWKDLCAEYDSANLYRAIMARKESYSPGFLAFIETWLADETNHARGFATIYRLIYGDSIESLYERLAARPADFSRLEEFLADEFKLCLLLAYDEIATTLTYRNDFEFYGKFGPPEFTTWIRRIMADEANHFGAAMRLIRELHAHRLPEVGPVMRRILELDLTSESYAATFVLDHAPECVHFTLDADVLSEQCAAVIVRKLTAHLNRKESSHAIHALAR